MSKLNLQSFIQNSNLNDQDKAMWQTVTASFSDDDYAELLAMFNDEGIDLVWLTENIKSKKAALTSNDSNALRKILDDEKEKLSQIL